ncbi:hypothetical protein [Bradyrhizobium manausense]|uniref:hypothetical protein n=1 Tax=Bradyrhizobium manausense TaxID=989370 RepID=UPI001BAA3DCE|nr:hypothetical protein [Bradyrhizobium manausense]MBR0721769.1 hypothetical protein [Bradyrhizobium manausense]
MNKQIKRLLMLTALVGSLMAPAFAADTSSTINVRSAVKPKGVSPQSTYTRATANAAAASAGSFTFDVPAPKGASNILGCTHTAEDANGAIKPLRITRSGLTISVSNGDMASSTIVSGDVVRVHCDLKP